MNKSALKNDNYFSFLERRHHDMRMKRIKSASRGQSSEKRFATKARDSSLNQHDTEKTTGRAIRAGSILEKHGVNEQLENMVKTISDQHDQLV